MPNICGQKMLFTVSVCIRMENIWHLGRTFTGKSKSMKVFMEAEKRKTIYEKLKVFEVEKKVN